jgi:hypothetical protein
LVAVVHKLEGIVTIEDVGFELSETVLKVEAGVENDEGMSVRHCVWYVYMHLFILRMCRGAFLYHIGSFHTEPCPLDYKY